MIQREQSGGTYTAWARSLLRAPLVTKIAGANLLIAIAAFAAVMVVRGGRGPGSIDGRLLLVVSLALLGGFCVNAALVLLALRPLQALETAAANVSRGDFSSRVPPSLLADRDMAQVGSAINLLLEGLSADRMRTRQLAAEVIDAGDRERAYVARELHDSVAQTLAALVMQIGAAARDASNPELAQRLATIRGLGSDSLEEVRMLAHTMHPRVLDDLGLAAALSHLATQSGQSHAARIVVDAERFDPAGLSASNASVLYRIAQEGVGNAVRHAGARDIRVRLTSDLESVTLEIADDGVGFDVSEAQLRRPGMGLFTMRERAALVDGGLSVESEPGKGTHVVARVPLETKQ